MSFLLHFSLVLLFLLSCHPTSTTTTHALILPPTDKIKMGLLEDLMEECEDESDDADADAKFVWEFNVEKN